MDNNVDIKFHVSFGQEVQDDDHHHHLHQKTFIQIKEEPIELQEDIKPEAIHYEYEQVDPTAFSEHYLEEVRKELLGVTGTTITTPCLIRSSSSISTSTCVIVEAKDLLSSSERRDGDKKCTWPDCPGQFSCLSALSIHSRVHTGERFPCEYCEKTFAAKSSVKQHRCKVLKRQEAANQPPPPVYKCRQCGDGFSYKKELERHQKRKLKTCIRIGATTKTSRLPKQSVPLVHSPSFSCPWPKCSKSFNFESNLLTHYRKAHSVMFDCEQCGTSFTYRRGLIKHKCKECKVESDNA